MNYADIAHGFHLFMDGNAWCAVGPHFQNLQESHAGFGDTQEQAVAALHECFSRDPWWDNKVAPSVEKFTVHQ